MLERLHRETRAQEDLVISLKQDLENARRYEYNRQRQMDRGMDMQMGGGMRPFPQEMVKPEVVEDQISAAKREILRLRVGLGLPGAAAAALLLNLDVVSGFLLSLMLFV